MPRQSASAPSLLRAVPAAMLTLALLNGCFTNDSNAGITVNRGPARISVDGDPNGLWWDYATKTLYMADDNGNRILKWTDAGGIALAANLAGSAGAGLGQLVVTANGTIVVTRFGNGSAGGVAYASASGDTALVPSLGTSRRRIGLTVASNDSLYVGWFTRANSTAPRVGSVGKLFLDGGEPEIMTGLQKPVGVLAVGAYLYVADQDQGKIFKAPLSNLSASSVFATLATPDLLCSGPKGSLFSGNTTGSVYKIDSAGNASAFAVVTDGQQVHGVAYDSVGKRLFVADHDPDASDGLTNYLRIFPVD